MSSKNTNLPKWWQSAARTRASAAVTTEPRSSASAASRSWIAAVSIHAAHQSAHRSTRDVVATKSL
jgi:hypothetical protein